MPTKDHWVEAALKNDAVVAEFLLRLKHSSSYSDSLNAPPPPSTSVTQTKGFNLPYWGHRKNRSKPPATISNVTNGIGKEQRGSPTTHLSWSGGGGSTSDGDDESSRPSDLSSGSRSVKANEGASTCSYNKSHKRKTFPELKDEEGSLLKERIHINKELVSMRVTLNQETVKSENLKRIKIDFDQNQSTVDDERKKKKASMAESCRVEAEEERGFVLPDLNMMPNEEDA